ncbi:MAG: DsbA family protein [Nocardioidaceae bacterium]
MTRRRSTATRRAESQAAAARAAAIRREQERKERRRRTILVVVAVAVLAAIGTAVSVYVDRTGAPSAAPQGAVATYAVPAGPASARVKVAVYEDFMCPFCGQFERASRTALQKDLADGAVQLQYHVLNFLDGSSTTDYSSRAANAYAAVFDDSGPQVAKKFHDLLFEHQPDEGSAGISDARLLRYAVQAGADRGTVSAAIRDRTYEQWVNNGTDQASKGGVTRTPTVKVNGKTMTFTTIDDLVAKVKSAVAAG